MFVQSIRSASVLVVPRRLVWWENLDLANLPQAMLRSVYKLLQRVMFFIGACQNRIDPHGRLEGLTLAAAISPLNTRAADVSVVIMPTAKGYQGAAI